MCPITQGRVQGKKVKARVRLEATVGSQQHVFDPLPERERLLVLRSLLNMGPAVPLSQRKEFEEPCSDVVRVILTDEHVARQHCGGDPQWAGLPHDLRRGAEDWLRPAHLSDVHRPRHSKDPLASLAAFAAPPSLRETKSLRESAAAPPRPTALARLSTHRAKFAQLG